MEKTTATKHIAVIESCSMSAMGLKHLFAMPALSHYQVHLFARFDNFKAALSEISFFAVIYSLSDEREAAKLSGLFAGSHLHPQRRQAYRAGL